MEYKKKYVSTQLNILKDSGLLRVVYALLLEALFIGFLIFVGLFTVETVLPTFVTVRFSLAKLLLGLIILSFVLVSLGRYLELSYSIHTKKIKPFFWLALFWSLGIFAVSLYKFPPIAIPIIVVGFLAVGYLFAKILLFEQK